MIGQFVKNSSRVRVIQPALPDPADTEGGLYYVILYKRLEHLQVLVCGGGGGCLKINSPRVLRDDGILFSLKNKLKRRRMKIQQHHT